MFYKIDLKDYFCPFQTKIFSSTPAHLAKASWVV